MRPASGVELQLLQKEEETVFMSGYPDSVANDDHS